MSLKKFIRILQILVLTVALPALSSCNSEEACNQAKFLLEQSQSGRDVSYTALKNNAERALAAQRPDCYAIYLGRHF